jgi:hypothetical protein
LQPGQISSGPARSESGYRFSEKIMLKQRDRAG